VWGYLPSLVMSRAQEATELSAHFHAATCELVARLAALDESREWEGDGFRSCAHWLTIHAGFEQWTAGEMIRVGHALRELPLVAAAFADGRLSFDKVRALVQVARPADEEIWLDIALAASVTQLARICHAFRRAMVVDDSERNARQHALRTFNAWWREDGMLRLVATLPPEEGRIVLTAVEDAVVKPKAAPSEAAEFPAVDTFGARRADALARVAEHWLGRMSQPGTSKRTPRQLVVHVDVETLLQEGVDGRCHLEDGPAVSADLARRIGCDSDVLVMIERGTTTLDLHRTKRAVSGRLRRALQLRDGFCRYPGCRVPAFDTDGHHIRHWEDGGPTELRNLVSLCGFHHQRLHEGAFRINVNPAGVIMFSTAKGQPIEQAPSPIHMPDTDGAQWLRQLSALAGRVIDSRTPVAQDHGAPFDLDLTTEVLTHSTGLAAARAGPT
jgi:Domain of unknown function (DUF222)/HNH endonuclease